MLVVLEILNHWWQCIFGTPRYLEVLLGPFWITSRYVQALWGTSTSKQSLWLNCQSIQISLQFYLALHIKFNPSISISNNNSIVLLSHPTSFVSLFIYKTGVVRYLKSSHNHTTVAAAVGIWGNFEIELVDVSNNLLPSLVSSLCWTAGWLRLTYVKVSPVEKHLASPQSLTSPSFCNPSSLSLPPQQIFEQATAAVVLWNIMARGVSPHREVTQY